MAALRGQFYIYVLSPELGHSDGLCAELQRAGYEVAFFPTVGSALVAIRHHPPHVILFDGVALADHALGFLEEIRDLSDEILVVPWIDKQQLFAAQQWVGNEKAYDFVVFPWVSVLEITQKLDRAIQFLFYRLGCNDVPRAQALPRQNSRSVMDDSTSSDLKRVRDQLRAFASIRHFDEGLRLLLHAVSTEIDGLPVLFFRETSKGWTLTATAGLSVSSLPALQFEKAADLPSLLLDTFGQVNFSVWQLEGHGNTCGRVVALAEIRSEIVRMRLDIYFAFWRSEGQRLGLLRDKHKVETLCSETGLVLGRLFSAKIDQEVARSRRLLRPVTLMLFEVPPTEFARAVGVVQKTSRINDILVRSGPSQIAIILPHTACEGGVQRAQRLTVDLQKAGLTRMSLPIGVSSYPEHAHDAEQLFRLADEALQQACREKGEGPVILVSPPLPEAQV